MTKALCACTTSTDSSSMFTAYSSRHCKPWTVSQTGLEFIAVLESGVLNGKNYLGHQVTNGFVLEVYKDSKGLPTVGLGHLVNDSDKLNVGDTITMERAQRFLKKSLADIEKRFNRDVMVSLYQFEYDACVSIAINCGPYAGSNDLIARLNGGDYAGMFEFILPYRIGRRKDLSRRRFQEARLFASGVYDARH